MMSESSPKYRCTTQPHTVNSKQAMHTAWTLPTILYSPSSLKIEAQLFELFIPCESTAASVSGSDALTNPECQNYR